MHYLQSTTLREKLRDNLPGLAAVTLLHGVVIYAFVQGMNISSVQPVPPPPAVTVLPPAPPPPPEQPRDVPFQQAAPPIPTNVVTIPKLDLAPPPAPPHTQAMPHTQATPSSAPPSMGQASLRPVQPDTVFTPSQVIRGAPRPDYPDSLAETPRQARVGVACTIETTGVPTLCHIVRSGGAAFDREALRWLNGPNHPVYRPSTRGGNPVAEDHAWSIEFQP